MISGEKQTTKISSKYLLNLIMIKGYRETEVVKTLEISQTKHYIHNNMVGI